MNKAVLISIRPKWCELIASSKKTIEVRKTRPKIPTPFKCYIYCTKARSAAEVLTPCNNLSDIRNGKIIGEFVCDYIMTDKYGERSSDFEIYGCLPFKAQKEYAPKKPLYGWHISNLVIYDEPKGLNDFGVNRPPQSWMYVEELT